MNIEELVNKWRLPETSIRGEYRKCPHGYHHPPYPHSCDGCWCEGERDREMYGWDHNTDPDLTNE